MPKSEKIGCLRKLSKNALTYGLGNVASQLLSVITLPIFTTYLSTSEYGVIGLITTVLLLAVAIFSLGLGASMGVTYFQEPRAEYSRVTVTSATFMMVVCSVLLVVVVWTLAPSISNLLFSSDTHQGLLKLASLGGAAIMMAQPSKLALQFEEKARLYVWLSIVTSLAGLMFSGYLVVIRGQGAQGWVLGFVAGNVLALILFTIAAVSNYTVSPKRVIVAQLLRVGIPLAPAFVVLLALAQGNRWILEKLTDIETVGVYTVGFSIGQAMNLFVGGVTTAWYPFFMERLKDLEANRVQFQRILRAYLVTGGVIALLFFVFSRPIVMILADDAFFNAHLVIGFSALAVLFTGLFSILLPGMYAANETRFVFLIQGVALLASVGINILFIQLFDPLTGAGIGLATSYIILVAVQLLWNRCRGYFRLTLPGREVAKMSGLSLAIVITTYVITPKSLGVTLLASICIGLVTVVMGYFCFPKSDRSKLLQLIGQILRPNLSPGG